MFVIQADKNIIFKAHLKLINFSLTLAKLDNSSGIVALNSNVYRFCPTFFKITLNCSRKPISKRKSASSKINISIFLRSYLA